MRRGILAGLLLAAAAAGDPAELVTTRLEWEPGRLGRAAQNRVPLRGAPGSVVPPPPGDAASLFAEVPLGEGAPMPVAIDPRPDSPRLWLDRDRDGDLLREKPLPFTVEGEWLTRWETLLVPAAGETVPVPASILFTVHAAQPTHLWWRARIHRRGRVVLGGLVRNVALGDDSHTLRFVGAETTRILLDVDGDGTLDQADGSPEWIGLGKPFRLLDEGWTFRVPGPGGGAVEFTRLPEAPEAAPRPWKPAESPYRPAPSTRKGRPVAEIQKAYRALPRDPGYDDVTGLLEEAAEQGTDEAFAFLKSVATAASSTSVRGYAVWYMDNPAFLPAHADEIAALARSSVVDVARNAVRILYRVSHPQAERLLLDLTASSSAEVASEAAYFLAFTGTEAARARVLDLAKTHRSPRVRQRAYEGCRSFAEPPPPALMEAAAREGDLALRVLALGDMARTGHPEARTAALAAATLGRKPPTSEEKREPDDLRALVDLLTARPDAECTAAALDLAVLGPDAVRVRAVERMALLRSKESMDTLAAALRAPVEARREVAARVLGRIPVSGVTERLAQALKTERSDAVATALVEALADQGGQGDPTVAGPLLRAARSQGALRLAAIQALARLGLGLDDVRKLLLDLLDGGSPEERILALEAVAVSGEATLVPRVAPALDHDSRALRISAVETLRRLRVRESVPPLVARLEKESVLRIRVAIGRALFELTGANFYEDAALWRRWLAEHGPTFQVPAETPRLPAADPSVSSGTFFGLPVESDRVVFVVDRSGSMDSRDAGDAESGADPPTRMETALRQTAAAVARLGRDARANVMLFDDKVHPWQKGIVTMTPANRTALEKHLGAQKPGTSTNLYDALEAALLDREADTVMLLSDGSPNEGRFTETADILAAVRALNRTRRVAVHCVSLGTDSELLRRLAAENAGSYVRR